MSGHRETKAEVARRLLDSHGTTWAAEAGFTIKDKPAPLFRLLCLCLLLSAPIGNELSVRAARALARQGWTTPDKMVASSWARRAKVLNESGYARFDEKTARMLAESSSHLLDRWGGDLRKLREEAGLDPDGERRLLKEHKGIGDAGVDIYFREVQGVWPEVSPFIDDRALRAARRLGLGTDARGVARTVEEADLPRLAAALIRIDLHGGYAEFENAVTT